MSTKFHQELRFWEVVEQTVRRNRHEFRSIRLSAQDEHIYCSALALQARLIYDTSPCGLSPSVKSDILRWCNTMANVRDVSEVASCLKECRSFICNYSKDRSTTYAGFKHQLRDAFAFIGGFVAPVRAELEEFFLSEDPLAFKRLYQFFTFMSHVQLRDIDLMSQSQEDYLAIECRLATLEYDYSIITQLNAIMRKWFPPFSCQDTFVPGHGPGSVATRSGRITKVEKYALLAKDGLIEYYYTQLGLSLEYDRFRIDGFDRVCDVIFVPKSMDSWRTISKEPASLQYLQHGQAMIIDAELRRHRYLRRIVDLHDQDRNRELAGRASAYGDYATIDLSAASDSVSWELVKGIFAGTPILKMCYVSRSREARLPDGMLLPLRKFAPMGSALCFPIECLVFASICEYAVRTLRLPSNEFHYSVYGDDIIIKTDVAPFLIDVLSYLGFKVNQAKSFVRPGPGFRESCGGHFYKGYDVTPMMLSRKWDAGELFLRERSTGPRSVVCHPDRITRCIDMANTAYDHKLICVRNVFLRQLLTLPKRFRPQFSEEKYGVKSPCPTNFQLEKKYSKNWQAEAIVCGQLKTIPKKSALVHEDLRLYEWLRANHDTLPSTQYARSASVGASATVWMPTTVSKS